MVSFPTLAEMFPEHADRIVPYQGSDGDREFHGETLEILGGKIWTEVGVNNDGWDLKTNIKEWKEGSGDREVTISRKVQDDFHFFPLQGFPHSDKHVQVKFGLSLCASSEEGRSWNHSRLGILYNGNPVFVSGDLLQCTAGPITLNPFLYSTDPRPVEERQAEILSAGLIYDPHTGDFT
jgi:hypothetical protein